jgi:quaternary ammonium compound-resistance protein SugE
VPPAPDVKLAWICLLFAGLLEIVWSLAMKASDGFSRVGLTALTVGGIALSVWLLSVSARTLPIGTAYAVWTGVGAAGTAIFGIVIFAEPVGAARLACIGLIVIGVIGLKALGGS